MINKVLLPVDGSPESEKAARYALQLAKNYNASITALNVIAMEPPIEIRHEEESKRIFARIKKIASEIGVKCDTRMVVDPDVYVVIVDEAREGNYDQIVMGTRGVTGLKSIMLGSVASNVIRHAHCPVTVVR